MKNPHDNYWIPDDGYEYITNGETWTHSIYLGAGADINDWHDTNDQPPEPGEQGEQAEPSAEELLNIILGEGDAP